jgi:putative toxin-antitoxin system antitoxin component (TIGR02293 family)
MVDIPERSDDTKTHPVPPMTPNALPEPASVSPIGATARPTHWSLDLSPQGFPFEFPELAAESPAEAARLVREGLPTDRFEALRAFLGISATDFSGVVGITSSTLSRRRNRGYFDKDESERLLRLARIAVRAVDVMESAENARQWLTEPARALGGETPLHFADTEPGAREVERLLGRIEHGVFS